MIALGLVKTIRRLDFEKTAHTLQFAGREVICTSPDSDKVACSRGVCTSDGSIKCDGCSDNLKAANFVIHCGNKSHKPTESLWDVELICTHMVSGFQALQLVSGLG